MTAQAPHELSLGSEANLMDHEYAKDDHSTNEDSSRPSTDETDAPVSIEVQETPQPPDRNREQTPSSSDTIELQVESNTLSRPKKAIEFDDPVRPSVVIHNERDQRLGGPDTMSHADSLTHQASVISAKSESQWDEVNQPEIDLSLPSLPATQRSNSAHRTNFAPHHSPPTSPRQSIARNAMDMQLETGGDVGRLGRSEAWCSPTRALDWAMHKFWPGKVMLMFFNWIFVINYGKDLYVAIHLFETGYILFGIITLVLFYLSLRVMLLVRATDDTITIWKLLLFYLPGSVYCDFQIDRRSDYAVCACWELLVDLGTPLMPFYLIFLTGNKTVSMLCGDTNFEHPHLLSFSVVECLFESIPQFVLQLFLRFTNNGVEEIVFDIALVVSIVTLLKIPIIVWYNWRIVHRLEFKRRHNGEVTAVCFHPSRDLIATGSWDHTVIVNNIVVDILKAKRVLDHHYNVNCLCFSHDGRYLAVGGQGVELWDWANGKVVEHYPKPPPRDRIGRRKRVRTDEVTAVCFSLEDDVIYTAEGKYLVAYKVATKEEIKKIRAQKDRLGQIKDLALSPNGKYIAAALYVGVVKIWDTRSWKQVRRLKAHTSEVSCVTFDRTGQYLVSGSGDTELRVWDFQRGLCIGRNEGHDSEVTCVCVDYENKMVLSASRDRSLRLYNFYDFIESYVMNRNEDEKEEAARDTLSATKKRTTLTAKEDEMLPNMKLIVSRTHHDRDVLSCEFSPFDDIFVSAGEDHVCHLFKIPPHMVPSS